MSVYIKVMFDISNTILQELLRIRQTRVVRARSRSIREGSG
jgi:hypothetical protein